MTKGWLCLKTRGPGSCCGDIFIMRGCYSTKQRLPTNSDDQNTIFTALPREPVGPRAPPALRRALGVRVGCTQLRRWVHSPRVGVLWRLNCSVKFHREFSAEESIIFVFFQILRVVWYKPAFFFNQKSDGSSFFSFFFFSQVTFLVWTALTQRLTSDCSAYQNIGVSTMVGRLWS